MKKILLILIIISFFSCSKDEEKETPQPVGTISSSLHPFLFKKGSYWIFKNQNTGQLDSVVVNSISKNIFTVGPSHPGQGSQGQEEYYNINYLSTINGSYDEQLIGYVISKGLFSGGYVYLSNHKIGEESLNAKLTNIYDSLSIESNLYQNVVKMENSKDSYLTSDLNLYYVDSIGLVKKEIISNDSIIDTWNLLRYSVNL